MAKLDMQYDILNDTPANASLVEANFNRIEQHINQEVIERHGTVAMAGQLQLVGDPQSAFDAAPKQYVDAIIPVGIIMMFGGVAVPPGGKWALCNGAELESALYPELFAVVSTTYSLEGTPAGRFNLPNLVNRFGIGAGSVATLGKAGGSRNPVVSAHSHDIYHDHPPHITYTENVQHYHNIPDHQHTVNLATSTDGDHQHVPDGGGWFMVNRGDAVIGTSSGSANKFVQPTVTGAAGAHAHTVSGWSSGINTNPATGGVSELHQHHFDVAFHEGRSGTEGVTDDAEATNLPPFLGVNYIIRVQ